MFLLQAATSLTSAMYSHEVESCFYDPIRGYFPCVADTAAGDWLYLIIVGGAFLLIGLSTLAIPVGIIFALWYAATGSRRAQSIQQNQQYQQFQQFQQYQQNQQNQPQPNQQPYPQDQQHSHLPYDDDHGIVRGQDNPPSQM